MPVHVAQVDAFTSRPFTGNPAAVCILDEPPPEWWLQDVAREMNLPETAFVIGHEEGFDLRSFTPGAEVEVCGHAALASAHVLWDEGYLAPDAEARFHTRTGLLAASRADGWIELAFTADPATETVPPEALVKALGTELLWVGRSRLDLLVELDSEKAVRTLHPDLPLLAELDVRGVIVTSPSISERFDFVSRYFAPRVGVPEDPVTGSAHCTLGPFWAARLGIQQFVGYQVSERGGMVRVTLRDGGVLLAGQAVTVMKGTLLA
jgi:PhzF family phenazine biosynthesis protein